ncbi:MAG: hypothetical protein WCO96_03315 [Actinomycetes bacterium]
MINMTRLVVIPVVAFGFSLGACGEGATTTSTEEVTTTAEAAPTSSESTGLDIETDICADYNDADNSTQYAFREKYSINGEGAGLLVMGCGRNPEMTLATAVGNLESGGMASYP